jgi:membrane-associated protease RseP (regulator of RpoE activity)
MPLVAVHELGHAWMARLLNWDVFAIVVGVGKVVRYFRVGKLTVELRIIPIEGFAQIAPRNGRFGGWRGALIYFAGPGIELLIFFVLMAIFGWSELITLSDSFAMTIVQGLAVAALVGAVLNLIPHGTYTGNGWIANDGLGILQCLFALNRKQRIRKSPFDEE